MKHRQLTIMAVATVVLVGLAVVSQRTRHRPTPQVIGQPVLADLDVNAISRIVLEKEGDAVTLLKQDDRWVVTNAFNYPADFKKLRSAILELADLKVGQVQHGMALPKDDRTTLRLLGQGDAALATLTLGPTREKKGQGGYSYPDGRFVQTGSGEVYLVKESLSDFATDAKAWLDTQIASVPAAEISVIEISTPGQPSLNFSKSSGTLEMLDLSDTEELDSSKTYGLESALSYLRFNAVADPTLSDESMGLTTGTVYRVKTTKGEIYTATIGGSPAGGTDRYLRLTVGLAPAQPAVEPAATDDEAAAEAAKAAAAEKAKARAGLESRVAETEARLKGWVYLVSSYSADNMTKRRDDLVKPKEIPEPDPTPVEAAAEMPLPPVAETVTEPVTPESAAPAESSTALAEGV